MTDKKEREERPKYSPSDDLDYRINGLEKAKMESGMTVSDIGALDRAIAKLQQKKAEKLAATTQKSEEPF